jgi:hypothetical protein
MGSLSGSSRAACVIFAAGSLQSLWLAQWLLSRMPLRGYKLMQAGVIRYRAAASV